MLDSAGQPGQRSQGHWTGLRFVETDNHLYDVWGDLNASKRAFTHIATSGRPAARLDRWLISEALRPRVSKEPRTIRQVVGYPGDHLGVSLCLTSPASTLPGSASWRLPLHLLDDQQFCERITADIPAYLAAHPLGDGVTRGSRWVELKRQVKDIAMQRSWALAAQRRASLRALEADSCAAVAAYARDTDSEDSAGVVGCSPPAAGPQRRSCEGCSATGIAWQFYGEQSTFWFHHLAKERQGRTELQVLRTEPEPDSPRAVLAQPAGRDQGGAVLRDYYSGDSESGLFAAQPVSQAAQDELLTAATAAYHLRSWRPLSRACRAAKLQGWLAFRTNFTFASGRICGRSSQIWGRRLVAATPVQPCHHRCCRAASRSSTRERGRTEYRQPATGPSRCSTPTTSWQQE
jgi:hypothetical protein